MAEIWKSPCGRMELRLGRWQDVLADVTECDAVITDPPFSETTHTGALDATTLERGVSYNSLPPEEATAWAMTWCARSRGWVVIHTDDVIGPVFRRAMTSAHQRYTFPLVPVLQQQPRVSGDGPPQHGHYLSVSRPRRREFLSWGSLPGWYTCGRDGSIVRGGKPLDLEIRIIRDYSRPGDLIVDPCAGGGTTLLAAAIEGRRAIGAECDPETYAKAVKRLSAGYTPAMTFDRKPKQKQEGLF